MNNKKYDGVNYPTREVTDLKDLVNSTVSMVPDTAAYLTKDKKAAAFVPISYRKVKEDLDALGTKFIDMGLKGQRVAVIGETSYYWILTYLTVVCGVGVIVPLDKNLPQNELLGLLERSGASALVYSDKSRSTIKPLFEDKQSLQYLISMDSNEDSEAGLSLSKLIEEGAELLQAGNRDYITAEIDPDQMSTLLFTSGTTGLAKGVMLSHRNLANNVMQLSAYFKIPDPGIVFSVLPIHHVYEMTADILTTFYQGKTIAICEGLRYIQKNMQEVHPNVMLGVPLIFEKMYKGMWKQAKHRGEDEKLRNAIDLSKRLRLYRNTAVVKRLFGAIHSSFGGEIKAFVLGGAAADPFIIEEFEAMGFPMVQGYGMSECSPIITLNRDRYRKYASAGQAVQGADVRIVDQDEDGIGEIIVRSKSVMMGYFENEEATRETIVDGWLHTGDLGYFDEDGFLYLTGRKKTVIVTKGGKNIFPEEVEDVLLQNDLIQEVVVHGVEDKHVGNVMVTADIFPNYPLLKEQQGEMTSSAIYHFYKDLVDEINKKMPPYKAVKRINIRTEEFVKTTTGKIKRYGNKLGSGEPDSSRKLEYPEQKEKEMRQAQKRIKAISASTDPFIKDKSGRPITDVRQLLLSSVSQFGKKTAFWRKDTMELPYKEVSYEEVLLDVNGLGTALRNHGLTDENFAIIGENSYQWVVSQLAVMCGVGRAVPLHHGLSKEELRLRMENADVTAVICSGKSLPKVKEIVSECEGKILAVICMDDDAPEDVLSWSALVKEGQDQMAQGDRQFLDAEVRGSDIAEIQFTDGMRGVCLSHTNICENIMAQTAVLEIKPDDLFLAVMPLNTTFQFVCGILTPLYKGAGVAFCPTENEISRCMRECRPTVILALPNQVENEYESIRRDLIESGQEKLLRSIHNANPLMRVLNIPGARNLGRYVAKNFGGNLRLIVCGGGYVDPDILDFMNTIGIAAVHGYGLTEAGPVIAVNPNDKSLMNSESAGHILPGLEVKILGRDDGGIGEILIKAASVMSGYYKDPAATEEAVKDEWLHTGDLGYLDEHGSLYVTGHKRTVIEIKPGLRVYPEELEALLNKIPYVRDSKVTVGTSEIDSRDRAVCATVSLYREEVAARLGEAYTGEQVRDLLWEDIDGINDQIPSYKRIKRVEIDEH